MATKPNARTFLNTLTKTKQLSIVRDFYDNDNIYHDLKRNHWFTFLQNNNSLTRMVLQSHFKNARYKYKRSGHDFPIMPATGGRDWPQSCPLSFYFAKSLFELYKHTFRILSFSTRILWLPGKIPPCIVFYFTKIIKHKLTN